MTHPFDETAIEAGIKATGINLHSDFVTKLVNGAWASLVERKLIQIGEHPMTTKKGEGWANHVMIVRLPTHKDRQG